MDDIEVHRASFRDNSGFIFSKQGSLYRQVNSSYKEEFDAYVESGLHQALVKKGYIVDHEEMSLDEHCRDNVHKVIKPVLIPYLTYPYEWSFSQLQDAAKLTLDIQLLALDFGFTLKDASAFNIQFYEGRPVLIDTLSFAPYRQGPWVAYRQFCQHFLAPLLLKKYCDHRLGRMAELYIDGIPLDLTSRLLPVRTWFSFNALSHIHLHAKMQSRYSASGGNGSQQVEKMSSKMDISKLGALIESLKAYVEGLRCPSTNTEWSDYYENTNYTQASMLGKQELIEGYLKSFAKPVSLLADLGANNGHFSRLASKYSRRVVSFDFDELAVEQNYLKVRAEGDKNVLPVVLDLFNPSPSIGWGNEERSSFVDREKFEVIIALALIHHLAISNNVPLKKIIHLLHNLVTDYLIIEFVPKSDSQVEHLLATREDIFPDYHEEGFEQALQGCFTIMSKDIVPQSVRTLYCLKRDSTLS
ncbi:class I SAM-dependent methyltransferase [uncultured Shewanella sp.]|uniref:class I SAM-dependent methyltransferase n=1 Tax=uncultured Shewanella sp. TaxID=173975 RepID=UPI00260444A1|nr:class I SAM-dependent methyltransferase [uncultured Shewanella sp.]